MPPNSTAHPNKRGRSVIPATIDLSGPWDFTYTRSFDPDRPVLPDAAAFSVQMPVPGYWDDHWQRLKPAAWWNEADLAQAQSAISIDLAFPDEGAMGSLRYLSGIGWYRRCLRLPRGKFDRKGRFIAILEFAEVAYYAHVWVNGRYVGRHLGSRSSFSFDVTSFCRPGAINEIIVAVGNDETELGLTGHLRGKCGGILGKTQLRLAGRGAVRDLFVRPGDNLHTVLWTAGLKVPAGRGRCCLNWRIRSWANGRKIAEGVKQIDRVEVQTADWSTEVPGIKPWSPDEPNLYVAEVRLVCGGEESDRFTRRFGMRRWDCGGHKLKLNGKPIFLRANCRSSYYPNQAGVPLDKQSYLIEAHRLKRLGFNTMKFLKMAPPMTCFEAADEAGMIVSVPTDYSPRTAQSEQARAVDELAQMVRSLRNYPSVSVYRLSGEQICTESFLTFLGQLYDAAKREDTGSLVLACHGPKGIEYAQNLLDEKVLPEPFWHHADRLRRLAACSDVFGQYPEGILSYQCPGPATWRDMDRRAAVYHQPLLSHEIGMKGSYLDLRNQKRYKHHFPPVYYQRLRRQLQALGLLAHADRYYRLSCRVQQAARKYGIEEARMCRSLAGYEYLGDTDHYAAPVSYPCGFMNEFQQLKPGETARSICRYQADNVLLLDFEDRRQRTFWAGQTMQGTWVVSLYGKRPIRQGRLTWQVLGDGGALLGGRMSVHDVPCGHVTHLGRFTLQWPRLRQAARLKLRATLSADGCRISNDWDFWIFPRRSAPVLTGGCDQGAYRQLQPRYGGLQKNHRQDRLRIVSRLTRRDIAHLEQGGDVVLMGTEPFPSWPIVNPIAMGHSSAASHQVGTVIHDHPLFRGFPHEGFGDWQIYPLLNEASRCVHFSDPDWPFDPILEVISSDKHVRRQAAIFELAVGSGRLLVCTCSIDLERPSTVALLDAIFAHVQSNRFRPRTAFNPDHLMRLCRSQPRIRVPRRVVNCPRVTLPPACTGEEPDSIWRQAAPLSSTLAGRTGRTTEAEEDYNAGAGAQMLVVATDEADEQDFAATVRLLHVEEYLYVMVQVTSPRFYPLRHGTAKPFSEPDSICAEFSRIQYGLAATLNGPLLMGGGPIRTDINVRGTIVKPSSTQLRYTVALPRAHTSAGARTRLDVDVTVFHGQHPQRRGQTVPALQFPLTLRLGGK